MKNKLIKLLMLSRSSNDNEALSAIRKANEILNNEKKTWDDVFGEAWYLEYSKLVDKYNTLARQYNSQQAQLKDLVQAELERPKEWWQAILSKF
jgi:hypothetical protein